MMFCHIRLYFIGSSGIIFVLQYKIICWCRGYSTLYCVLVNMSFYYLVLLNLDCGLTYCLVFIHFI